MPFKWGQKTWFSEYEIRREFGISPETLTMWRTSEPLLTIRMLGDTMYEEQSLRACIARHQRDRGKQ